MNMLYLYMCVFALNVILVSSNPISLRGCKSNEGDCEDLNILCEFIPLPHILCSEEKINQQCPKLCNSCPVSTTVESEYVWEDDTENDTQENTESYTENYDSNYTDRSTVTESGWFSYQYHP